MSESTDAMRKNASLFLEKIQNPDIGNLAALIVALGLEIYELLEERLPKSKEPEETQTITRAEKAVEDSKEYHDRRWEVLGYDASIDKYHVKLR